MYLILTDWHSLSIVLLSFKAEYKEKVHIASNTFSASFAQDNNAVSLKKLEMQIPIEFLNNIQC